MTEYSALWLYFQTYLFSPSLIENAFFNIICFISGFICYSISSWFQLCDLWATQFSSTACHALKKLPLLPCVIIVSCSTWKRKNVWSCHQFFFRCDRVPMKGLWSLKTKIRFGSTITCQEGITIPATLVKQYLQIICDILKIGLKWF